MVKTMKQDITKAIQFSNTFRYIDDLFSINNVNFGNCISAIYPSELELKDTSTSSTEVCYLDTNIKTGDVTTPFRISIYDKRDDFAFRIVNFPHMDSNIPANPAYSVYISQLVRYARICTSKVNFLNRLRGLSLRLRQQGFETNRLQNSFNSFISLIAMVLSWRSMVQPCGRWDQQSRLKLHHRILTLLIYYLDFYFSRILVRVCAQFNFGRVHCFSFALRYFPHLYVLSATVLTRWVAPPKVFCNWYRI